MDSNISKQDRVKKLVIDNYSNNRETTLDEIANKLGMTRSDAYQVIYRLTNMKEIEVFKERDEKSGHNIIKSIRPIRMEPVEQIEDRIKAVKVDKDVDREKKVNVGSDKIPKTIEYANAKLAVMEAQQLLQSKGVHARIDFDIDPIGEEAIYLLTRLEDKIRENASIKQDLIAAQRNLSAMRERSNVDDKHKEEVPVSAGANN